MKEQPKMGMNRTGVQMSPLHSGEMTDAIATLMHATPGDADAMARIRSDYAEEADPLGSVPVPGTVKGAFTMGVSMVTGNVPQLLIDKLGERLAFERTGTRLYDALIAKIQALEPDNISTLSIEKLQQIHDDEARHFALVAKAIRGLGGDPTAQTPCADVAGMESSGLMQTVTDPRTTSAQALHAILVAELADNSGWELLIALAEQQHHDAMAADFRVALEQERKHLLQIRSWFEEATLGSALLHEPATDPATQPAGGPQLH
jgi:hypothetical protein